MGIFGWDLPPGCSINDIPGNDPHECERENFEEDFWEKNCSDELWKKLDELKLSDAMMNIVSKAIDAGIEIGRIQEKLDEDERKYEEQLGKDFTD